MSFPRPPLHYVAGQVKVTAELAAYEWSGRTIEYHRRRSARVLGFREATREDETRAHGWLADEVCPVELVDEQLREALLARCRVERIEPPGRVERIIGAARAAFERAVLRPDHRAALARDVARLERCAVEAGQQARRAAGVARRAEGRPWAGEPGDAAARDRQAGAGPGDRPAGSAVRAAARRSCSRRGGPGRPRSIRRICARQPGGAADAARGAVLDRNGEIIDALVELLIALVNKIDASAERRVEGELVADLKRVRGKEAILFRAGRGGRGPSRRDRAAGAVPGGREATLRDLVREAKATKTAFGPARPGACCAPRTRTTTARCSPKLLDALEFRSNNTAYRPVMDALDVAAPLRRRPAQQRYYAADEQVPSKGSCRLTGATR